MKAADDQLIERVRNGDREAFGELWERHHQAGIRAARAIAPGLDADDLVSEAFTRILDHLGNGKGPERAFRPYLYQVIRNLAASAYAQSTREITLGEYADELISDESQDIVRRFNINAVDRAFAALPERWQEVLWYTEVEGLPPRKAAGLLGMTASSVAALALRARKGLRKAWIIEHVKDPDLPRACKATVNALSGYLNRKLRPQQRYELEEHISSCPTCREFVREGKRVFKSPGALLAASILGAATATALKLGGLTGVGTAAHTASAGLLSGSAGKTVLTTASLTAAVTAAVMIAGTLLPDNDRPRPELSAPDGEHSDQNSPRGTGSLDDDEAAQNQAAEGSSEGSSSRERPPSDDQSSSPDPPDPPDSVAETDGENGVDEDLGDRGEPPPSDDDPDGRAPEEPVDPPSPEIDDALPQTLPQPSVNVARGSGHRLSLHGRDAQPGATVRVLVTTQPTDDGAQYGTLMLTRASQSGYWAFPNVGGVAPFNASAQVQQIADESASPWVTAVADETFPVSISGPNPRDYTGVYGWHVRGWPGAHWGLREVGQPWPIASGTFEPGGGAVIPVPSQSVSSAAAYEVGYWVQGRFEPTHRLVRVLDVP